MLIVALMTTSHINAQEPTLADMPSTPFTIEAVEAGAVVAINKVGSPDAVNLQYSTNGGANWSTYTIGSGITLTNVGNKVSFRATSTNSRLANSSISGLTDRVIDKYHNISCSAATKIYGNIMSLLYNDNLSLRVELPSVGISDAWVCTLAKLFLNNTNIDIAVDEDWNPLLLLPATTLTNHCYEEMFKGCTSLTIPPALPAYVANVGVKNHCYESMFEGCTSLLSAPTLHLENDSHAFENHCFESMFAGCTSLKYATAISVGSFGSQEHCCKHMYQGCSNLKKMTCLTSEHLSLTGFGFNKTDEWLDGVSGSGRFICKTGASWEVSTSGIPSGWSKIETNAGLAVQLYEHTNIVESSLKWYIEQSCYVSVDRDDLVDGKGATFCLPFDFDTTGMPGTFYTFAGVSKSGDEWTATMTENTTTMLTAHTPYLYMPTSGANLDFSGIYTIGTLASLVPGEVTVGDWTLKGMYHPKVWKSVGNDYGFAANEQDGYYVGDFAKLGVGASILAMRCYLTYSGYGNPTYKGRKKGKTMTEELPDRIRVRLLSHEEATAISSVETEQNPDHWYNLQGQRLQSKPLTPGIYIYNGRKIKL